jgi:hypothetical protein
MAMYRSPDIHPEAAGMGFKLILLSRYNLFNMYSLRPIENVDLL